MKRALRYVLTIALVAVVMLGASGQSQAGTSALNLLNPSIKPNTLHDADVESVLDSTGTPVSSSHVITTGDLLLSAVQITTVNSQFYPGGSNVFSAVILLRVGSTTPNGTVTDTLGASHTLTNFTFVAPTATDWANATGGNVALSSPPAGTILQTFDNTQGSAFTLLGATRAAVLANASTGPALWKFGFTSTPNGDGTVSAKTSAGEGWSATAPNTLAGFTNASGNFDANVINASKFVGALNVIGQQVFIDGNGRSLSLAATFDNLGAGFNALIPAQIQVEGKFAANVQGSALSSLGSNSDNFVQPQVPVQTVPEPSSMVTMVLGAWILALGAYYHRKSLAALAA